MSTSYSLLVAEKDLLAAMITQKALNPPKIVPLARGYTYFDYYTLKTHGAAVELWLGGIRWRRCFFFAFLFALAYAAIVALSCLTNPTAEVHPFVYILGGMIALSPFVFPIAQQRLLSHQRPSVRLRLDDRVANMLGSSRSYPFYDIAAFADCTWIDDEGSTYGELQVLARDDDGYRWRLVAQCMGAAENSLRCFAEELSRIVGAAHITLDNRG